MLTSAVGPTTGLRLDWNESPLGPSPQAVARVVAHAGDLHRYPRGLLGQVTTAVADYHEVPASAVLLTNGVDEAVDLALSLVRSAWYALPGFDGYADRVRAAGKPGHLIPLDDRWEPTIVPADLARAGGAVFVAQPHNPTGNLFGQDWVREVLAGAQLAFLDATYADFASVALPVPSYTQHPRLLVFHSFSKSFGLAGIRLGALVADPSVIAELGGRQRFHSVDSVALHAVAGALDDLEHKARLCRYIRTQRPRYVATLTRSAVFTEVCDTHANFVVARCRDDLGAERIAADLADRDVWVRDCSSLGLPGSLRISVGTPEELLRMADVLDEIAAVQLPG